MLGIYTSFDCLFSSRASFKSMYVYGDRLHYEFICIGSKSIFIHYLFSISGVKREGCFACEFESLILKAREGNSPLSPIRILSQLQNIGNRLGNGREEDAHEFLRCAFEFLGKVNDFMLFPCFLCINF